MQQFFIVHEGEKQGPFDLVSMIKKIRNFRLQPTDLILTDDSEHPMPASQIEALAEYFVERNKEPEEPVNKQKSIDKLDPVHMLKEAWASFQDHQILVVFAGLGAFTLLIITLILSAVLPDGLAAILAMALSGAMMFVFFVLVLHRLRGRTLDEEFVQSFKTPRGIQLLSYGAGVGVLGFGLPMMIGMVAPIGLLLLIPGALVFGLVIFTPFLWVDDEQNPNVKELMVASKDWLLSQDMDTIGIVLFLVCINLVAASLLLFPLFITLPLTTIALADLYDVYFTRKI